MNDPIEVLLVDDQELVRTGLRRILRRQDGFVIVGECADGTHVPAAISALEPDLVLMDLRMKLLGGIETITRVRAEGVTPPILVLTTFDDDELLSGALRAGAAGFLLKDAPAEDLIRASRIVAGGGAFLDPSVTARVLDTYRSAPRNHNGGGHVVDVLTARELDVLRRIGRGLSNGEIADELGISEVTVKSHVGNLFAKLDLRDRPAAIVYAFDNGLVSPGERR